MTVHSDIPPSISWRPTPFYSTSYTHLHSDVIPAGVTAEQNSHPSIMSMLTSQCFRLYSSKCWITTHLPHNTHNFTVCNSLPLTLSTKHAARTKSLTASLSICDVCLMSLATFVRGKSVFFDSFRVTCLAQFALRCKQQRTPDEGELAGIHVGGG